MELFNPCLYDEEEKTSIMKMEGTLAFLYKKEITWVPPRYLQMVTNPDVY